MGNYEMCFIEKGMVCEVRVFFFIVCIIFWIRVMFIYFESYVSLMVKVYYEYGKCFMKWGKGRGGRGRVLMKFEWVFGFKLFIEGGMIFSDWV